MRRFTALTLSLLTAFALYAPGHTGTPPMLPEIDEVAPATISASATSAPIVGTSWCAVGVGNQLKCKKNGVDVTLSFNSITTNWPHIYHLDKTWTVNLTPLNLVAGDVLVWEFSCWATSGSQANRKVYTYQTTNVQ